MDYLTVKWLHVLSSVLLVGTGFGSAFYLFFANRCASAPVRSQVAQLVVRADWWFTTPAVIFQPLSGAWLMHRGGWTWDTPWIATSIVLFLLAGACWLPVVALQLRMARMARECVAAGVPLPGSYGRLARLWEWLGYPAFVAMVAVFYLMVTKPG